MCFDLGGGHGGSVTRTPGLRLAHYLITADVRVKPFHSGRRVAHENPGDLLFPGEYYRKGTNGVWGGEVKGMSLPVPILPQRDHNRLICVK